MALNVDVEVGQAIRIGTSTITVEAKNGRRARLRIDSSEDVSVGKPPDDPSEKPIRDGLSRRLPSG